MPRASNSDGSPVTSLLVAIMILCLLELWLGSVEQADRLAQELDQIKSHGKTKTYIGTAD